jgi:hypothetical protein
MANRVPPWWALAERVTFGDGNIGVFVWDMK